MSAKDEYKHTESTPDICGQNAAQDIPADSSEIDIDVALKPYPMGS